MAVEPGPPEDRRFPVELVLATRNAHKLTEFRRLLEPAGLTVVALPLEVVLPPEDGETFLSNALPKARAAAHALGRAAIADDSGIESAALDGRPGVRSARYAGEHASDAENLAELLAQAPAGSGLRYVCAVAYVDPGAGTEQLFTGICEGTLAAQPRGSHGFGYDPAFLVPEDPQGRTMAQLGDAEKDRISHRGNAARALAAWLRAG
jgi:XTP/dITP diphosphohydrolase